MTDKQPMKGVTGKHYADVPPSRRTRQSRRASAFKRDPGLEQVLELQQTDPAAFAALGRDVRLAAAYYRSSKEAHEEVYDGNGNA